MRQRLSFSVHVPILPIHTRSERAFSFGGTAPPPHALGVWRCVYCVVTFKTIDVFYTTVMCCVLLLVQSFSLWLCVSILCVVVSYNLMMIYPMISTGIWYRLRPVLFRIYSLVSNTIRWWWSWWRLLPMYSPW